MGKYLNSLFCDYYELWMMSVDYSEENANHKYMVWLMSKHKIFRKVNNISENIMYNKEQEEKFKEYLLTFKKVKW